MKKTIPPALMFAGACLLAAGCQTYVPPHTIDTGGPEAMVTLGLNPRDFMNTAQKAAAELKVSPAITTFAAENGRKPRVDIGIIQNKTSRPRVPIVIEQVSERIAEELLNSGQITLVANDGKAVQTNKARSFLNNESVNLDGLADFYLEGEIFNQSDAQGNLIENNFSFMLRMNDSATRSQVWKKTLDVTKQGSY
ncbi:MAG: penicillin-binding protein activator LpoB [Kiritimatiellaeota bacterium]|nr:penicillin-binding protein activator LpoB [Kiritimatiellota bacterium]